MSLTKVTNEMLVGPLGSSSGDKNLVSNGDLEAVSASIFVPYQNAEIS